MDKGKHGTDYRDALRKEVAFLRAVEKGARARRDIFEYLELQAIREAKERLLTATASFEAGTKIRRGCLR